MRGDKTQYEILGISPEASLKEIRQAYRKGALKYHPDNRHPARKEAEAKFRKLAKAYKAALRAHLPEFEKSKNNGAKKPYSPADLARMDTKWHSTPIDAHYTYQATDQLTSRTATSRSVPTIDENRVFVISWAIATGLGIAIVLSGGAFGIFDSPQGQVVLLNILAVEAMAILLVAAVLTGSVYCIVRTRDTIWLTLQWGVRLLTFLPKAHKPKQLSHLP
jgi:hypothetical protein